MEQSEKRLKTEIIDEDFIVPDHDRGYNVDNMKTEAIAGEDETDDPFSDNDCDIGPVKNQFLVNEGINELTQPENKLTKVQIRERIDCQGLKFGFCLSFLILKFLMESIHSLVHVRHINSMCT
nr:uncharacterized protein LOC6627666 isoform X4 [Drosophila virilis]XP_032293454.1 uncharacterized protein LOC6627666 isoform X4 [Drosophila virilis]